MNHIVCDCVFQVGMKDVDQTSQRFTTATDLFCGERTIFNREVDCGSYFSISWIYFEIEKFDLRAIIAKLFKTA